MAIEVFLSVILLSLSFSNSIFVTQSMSRVYAAEVGIAVAGDAAWKLILGFLAGTGLAGAFVSNKEAVIAKFWEMLDSKYDRDEELVNQMGKGVMNIYDSASGAVRSLPWDEFTEAIKDYHDSAVDSLTGIYAQYCPALIGVTKDFAYGIATGAIVIEGFNDNVKLNEDIIEKQWSGEFFDYSVTVKSIDSGWDRIYNFYASYNVPVAAYLNLSNADKREYSLKFYKVSFSGVVNTCNFIGSQTAKMINGGNTYVWNYDDVSVSAISCDSFSYSTNLPVFASYIDMENYLKGMGDVTGAINWDGVIDNNDLPLWGLAEALANIIARTPDIGIGSYGDGTTVNDWADDLPFIGLDDLQDYIDKLEDVIDKIRDGILDGTYDLPDDIPDITDPYTDAWNDVVDGSIPADDPVVRNPDKPVPFPMPVPGDTDIDDSISYPIEIPDDISLDDVIKVPGFVPDLAVDFSDLVETFKRKFPFSIPWDLYHLLSGLANSPKTPVYYLPLVIERWGVDEVIVVDMSDFEEISILSRSMLSLLFAFGLMKFTVAVVSVIKEE